MTTHVDDREQLEPGAGIKTAPAPDLPITALIDGTAAGASVTQDEWAGFVDYFEFEHIERWYFPDGKQWIEFRRMNEGDRAKFQRRTRPDVSVNQRSGEAKIPFDAANERHELILSSVIGWYVVARDPRTRAFVPVPFTKGSQQAALDQWLRKADPIIVMDLEKRIRMANPWMLSEMSVEQIDKEIADLNELRAAAVEREAQAKNS